ncbi:hypothetical protein ILUMI_06778 [Ignelater luminosus]|uniref:Uncharacterized protein n=1 Tax=Ignelater luminosus TaxID=2038154 RepID=A0A8K0D8M3_IGNLU|nr:hypothetical protein ILUMI_06778 [Ignelater luminosus]
MLDGRKVAVTVRNDREKFVQDVEQEIANQAEALGKARLVELWEAFKQVLLEVAEQVCGKSRSRVREKRTKWWNNEVKREIKLKKRKFKEYLRASENEKTAVYSRYKKQRRVARDAVKRDQEQSWEEFGRKIKRKF